MDIVLADFSRRQGFGILVVGVVTYSLAVLGSRLEGAAYSAALLKWN